MSDNKELHTGSYVSFNYGNKNMKGVITKITEKSIEVDATSRYVKKDNFWQLYKTIYAYYVPKNHIKIEKCECERIMHSDFISDRGAVVNSAYCPDCYWDCVS